MFNRCRHQAQGASNRGAPTRGCTVQQGSPCAFSGGKRLQEAIRRQLAGTARREPAARRRARQRPGEALAALSDRRRKLLELHYNDQISGELFAEEEGRLATQIESIRTEAMDDREKQATADDVTVRFEAVAAALRDLDIERMWEVGH